MTGTGGSPGVGGSEEAGGTGGMGPTGGGGGTGGIAFGGSSSGGAGLGGTAAGGAGAGGVAVGTGGGGFGGTGTGGTGTGGGGVGGTVGGGGTGGTVGSGGTTTELNCVRATDPAMYCNPDSGAPYAWECDAAPMPGCTDESGMYCCPVPCAPISLATHGWRCQNPSALQPWGCYEAYPGVSVPSGCEAASGTDVIICCPTDAAY